MEQIITCTGYGFTGSSAATNIIEEFKDVKSLDADFECTFLHEADGIKDLENALKEGHRLKVDLAIKRFLRLTDFLSKEKKYKKYFNGNFKRHSVDYIDSICKAKWQGNWHRGSDTIKYSKEDLLYYNLAKQVFLNEYSYSQYSLFEPDSWHPTYQMRNKSYYAFFDDSFYTKTQEYINKLFSEIALHSNAKRILIDQFFSAYDAAGYLNYAPETKIIIVDRDPRDMYVLNKSSWVEPYIPTDSVDVFIAWYKGIRSSQKEEAENKSVLLIRFEDLIFNYEQSLTQIKEFLSLKDEEHILKKEKFDPNKSSKNSYKFKNYPQWVDDILKIEKELSEYCYNFPDDCDNNISIDKNKPVELYKNEAAKIQIEKKLSDKYQNKLYSLIFGMTKLGLVCESMIHRKTVKAKIKGIIKYFIFFPTFLIEYPYLLFCYHRDS